MREQRLKEIIKNSVSYELEDGVLTLTGYYTGKEIKLNLNKLTEEMLEEVCEPTEDDIKEELKQELEDRGLELNEEECDLTSAAEYIMQTRDDCDENYSVTDWILETKVNYPECFK